MSEKNGSLVGLEAELFINSKRKVEAGEGNIYSPDREKVYHLLRKRGGKTTGLNIKFDCGIIGYDTLCEDYVYEINTNPERKLILAVQDLTDLLSSLKKASPIGFRYLKGWSIHFNYSSKRGNLNLNNCYNGFSTKDATQDKKRLHIKLDFPTKVKDWNFIYEAYSFLESRTEKIFMIGEQKMIYELKKILSPLINYSAPVLIDENYLFELTDLNNQFHAKQSGKIIITL